MARKNIVMVRLNDEELKKLKKLCKKTFGEWNRYYGAEVRFLINRAK